MMLTRDEKDRAAHAVHRAVTTITGGTGAYRCLHYAHAGQGLLQHLGIDATVRVGDLQILDWRGKSIKTLRSKGMAVGDGTFDGHAWLEVGGRTVIDFAARHFATYARSGYRRTPPDYLWGDTAGWARYRVDEHAHPELIEPCVLSGDLMINAINAWEGSDLYELVEMGRDARGWLVKGISRRLSISGTRLVG